MEPPIRAWSFSRLEVFEKCPYRAYLKIVERRPEPPSERRDVALDKGRRVHDLAESYVRGDLEELPNELGKFSEKFEYKRKVFAAGNAEVEEDWAYDEDWQRTEWSAPGTWLRVKLDWMEWHDEERTSAAVIDYKTGRKDGNEVKHSQQGQLYVLAAFMRYPSLQVVRVEFEYLDHGKTSIPKIYTREQAMKFFANFDERGRKMTEATVFTPRPNRVNCKFCPYGPDNGDGSCEYGVET